MPMDSIENARFAVNFYTSIGLGAITEDMRDYLERAPKEQMEARYAELMKQAQELNELSDSSSDDSSSSSSSQEKDAAAAVFKSDKSSDSPIPAAIQPDEKEAVKEELSVEAVSEVASAKHSISDGPRRRRLHSSASPEQIQQEVPAKRPVAASRSSSVNSYEPRKRRRMYSSSSSEQEVK